MDTKQIDSEPGTCPCESGKPFKRCCGPLLAGEKAARTPEELMRSRYSAYKEGKIDYILNTWHPDTRPESIEPDSFHNWCGLEILSTSKGKHGDKEGFVEFRAAAHVGLTVTFLHELSRFVKDDGRWVYIDGTIISAPEEQAKQASKKVGRNSPCPCGSGRKFKRCCAR